MKVANGFMSRPKTAIDIANLNLREAADPWADRMSLTVFRHRKKIGLRMREIVRAWADQAHLATQHI